MKSFLTKHVRALLMLLVGSGLAIAVACGGTEIVVETVIVEKQLPGQTITEKVVETVVVEKVVEGQTVRVIETVIVDRPVQVTEKVVETVIVERTIAGETVKVVETVIVERPVTERVVETVIVTQEKVVEKVVQATAAPRERLEIQVALGAMPVSMTGGLIGSQQARLVSKLMYDSIAERPGGSGAFVPALGSWEINDLLVTVKLRDDVSFHNGESLNAEGIKYNIETLTEGDAELAFSYAYFRDYSDITVVDDTTLEFTLSAPTASWLFPFRDMMPLAPDHLRNLGIDAFNEDPAGTGPFQFVEWRREDFLTITRFEDYWRGKPLIDEIKFLHIPETAVRVAAFEAGQVQIAAGLAPNQVPRLLSKGYDVFTGESFQTQTVWIDPGQRSVPTQDVNVRRAILHAIDLKAIHESIVGGYGTLMDGQMGTQASTVAYNTNIHRYEYDPEKAKQLIADAGYPDGFTIGAASTTGRYFRDLQFMTAMASQLAEVGIKVEMETPESAEWVRQLINNQLPALYNIGMNWHPDDAVCNNRFISEGGDPVTDDLCAHLRTVTDDGERNQLLMEAAQHVHDQAQALYAYTIPAVYGLAPGLPDITFGMGFEMFIATE
jgi:peptide/nickel transport system substrate-binding protein